jgi:hypothetical protein
MKRKPCLIIVLFLFLGMETFSQTYTILAKPAGGKDWGYANVKGEFFIEPKFKDCISFSQDGLAAIYDGKQKRYYFIDLKGEVLPTEITDFKLFEVFLFGMKGFNDGFVAVKYKDLWGFLNTEGKLVVDATFEKVTPFNDGYASGLKGGKFYVIDENGNETPLDISGLEDVNEFNEGLASFKTTGDLFFMNETDIWEDFFSGLARGKKDGKFGFYNSSMEWVIPPQFDGARDFKNGYASVKKGEIWGIIDTAGNWVVEPTWDDVKDVTIVK